MDFMVSQVTDTAERSTVPEFLDGVWERGYRPPHTGCRPRLRHPRLCAGHPCAASDPACHTKATLDHRGTRDPSCRLRSEPSPPQAGGGGFQLDEDCVDSLRRTRYRGVARTGVANYLATTSYHLVHTTDFKSKPETAAVPSA